MFKAGAGKECFAGPMQAFKASAQAACCQKKANPLELPSPQPIPNAFTVNCCLFRSIKARGNQIRASWSTNFGF